jgi:hypothetical protein
VPEVVEVDAQKSGLARGFSMSAQGFLTLLMLGAALIAIWTDRRFPGLTPRGFTGALVAVFASTLLVHLTTPLVTKLVDTPTPAHLLTAIFMVTLPALTFAFLSGVWLIKVTLHALDRTRR